MSTRRPNVQRKKRSFRPVLLILILLAVTGIIILMPHDHRRPLRESSEASLSLVDSDPSQIPEYAGEDCIELNGGIPCFNEWDLNNISGEHYSELDLLGRCGTAYAMLDDSMMPADPRGEIGMIRPSGWRQTKYEGIINADPPFLYNRCHLIAYALTGQNANERNLITGTGYMNFYLMLPWEEQVIRYLESTDGHVLYRVSPYFHKKELVARGVEMEAYSIEDKGISVCFHVFIYNIQPGIDIDYETGESTVAGD